MRYAADARHWLAVLLVAGGSMGAALLLAGADDDVDPDILTRPLAGLNSADLAKFNYGRGLFHHTLRPVVHADGRQSGPGPFFNRLACDGCHIGNGRGQPPMDGVDGTLVLALIGTDGGDPVYGAQIQDRAISGVRPEGRVTARFDEGRVTLADGSVVVLHQPTYIVDQLAYGALDDATRLAPRLPPALIGMGLLEAVAEDDIVARADPQDLDQDGISGRPAWVGDRLGRFGWKAEMPDLIGQTVKAARIDMGLGIGDPPRRGDCVDALAPCRAFIAALSSDRPDLSSSELRLIAFYVARLAVPERNALQAQASTQGEDVFRSIGCASCHLETLPVHTKALGTPVDHIAPYTDLLLHDMGPGLADPVDYGYARAAEWRTPPLWGLGRAQQVGGMPYYLHDGRARSLIEAILWHGGEATRSRDSFANLPQEDRDALLAFLGSL